MQKGVATVTQIDIMSAAQCVCTVNACRQRRVCLTVTMPTCFAFGQWAVKRRSAASVPASPLQTPLSSVRLSA